MDYFLSTTAEDVVLKICFHNKLLFSQVHKNASVQKVVGEVD